MKIKHIFTTTAIAAALTIPVFADNPVTSTAKKITSNTAALGRGLVSTPGSLLRMGNNELPKLSQGVQEFGLSGNIDFSDNIAYNLNLSYGKFFKDNWLVGFTANVQGEESDASFGLGLFTEYNFVRESKWVPFIGGAVKWASLNSDFLDADSIALGLEFGVKYFIRENVALSFSMGAEYAFKDVFPGGDDFQQNVKIGTRFYF